MLACQKLPKLVRACQNYSLPKLARFLRHIIVIDALQIRYDDD